MTFPLIDFTSPKGNATYWWLCLFWYQKNVKKLKCPFGQLRCIHIVKTGYFGYKKTQKHKNNEQILQNWSPPKGTLLNWLKIHDWPFELNFLAIPSLDNSGDFGWLIRNWWWLTLRYILNQCKNVCELWCSLSDFGWHNSKSCTSFHGIHSTGWKLEVFEKTEL